jgi:hypothetical protein
MLMKMDALGIKIHVLMLHIMDILIVSNMHMRMHALGMKEHVGGLQAEAILIV